MRCGLSLGRMQDYIRRRVKARRHHEPLAAAACCLAAGAGASLHAPVVGAWGVRGVLWPGGE